MITIRLLDVDSKNKTEDVVIPNAEGRIIK